MVSKRTGDRFREATEDWGILGGVRRAMVQGAGAPLEKLRKGSRIEMS